MAKEPWEEKIVETKGDSRSRRNVISTSWITGILSVFFIIVVAILFVVFYTSNRGGDKASETAGFAGAKSSKVAKSSTKSSTSQKESTQESSSSTSDSSSSSSSSSSKEGKGDTITVLSGEGAASIAARAGISVEELQRLNPEHMTQGYWYANPGDQVYIN